MTETRTRFFSLDRKAGTGNVFPAVATTEAPVDRQTYYEVLDMARADLSRAPLPFIESHDTERLNIGVAENLQTDGDKLRCVVRLGNTSRANELAKDIAAGIVTGVSIGYQVTDGIEDGEIDGKPVIRFGFCPHELSAVSVPADINAGFYRQGLNPMETKNAESKAEKAEQNRVECIRSMAQAHDLSDLGMQAIVENWSFDSFNERALGEVGKRNDVTRTESNFDPDSTSPERISYYAGMPADTTRFGTAMEEYSVLRVLRSLTEPGQEAGLEREISKDMERATGVSRKGIVMPYEAIQRVRGAHNTRAVTVGGTGGNLVPTDHMAGSFIDVLRNSSHVMNLGPTVLQGLVGDVDVPKKTAGASAFWIGGDNADSITESDLTLGQVNLSPNTVGGAVTFSHKTIIQSSPDIESLVRGDLADLIASEIDAKSLQGTGASNQPTGILNTSGIGSTTYTNGGTPDLADIVALETALANANADIGNLAYLTTPTIAGLMKTTDLGTDTGQFVWKSNMMNDLAALKTGNMPAGYVLLGNWQHLLVGFWGGITLDADPYGSNFLKGSVTVRIIADLDINVRHAGAFAEIHEAA